MKDITRSKLLNLRNLGKTKEDIRKEYNLSTSAVNQLFKEAGISGRVKKPLYKYVDDTKDTNVEDKMGENKSHLSSGMYSNGYEQVN